LSNDYRNRHRERRNLTLVQVANKQLTNGMDDEFQVFLATDNTTTKTLTIDDGVWWGYQAAAVPEPSTWILLVSGCGSVAFARRRELQVR